MADTQQTSRRGWQRVDLQPVDDVLEHIRRLSTHQRDYLISALASMPGVLRSQMGAWSFLFEVALRAELPAATRQHMDSIWKAIDRVCMKHDRRVRKGEDGLSKLFRIEVLEFLLLGDLLDEGGDQFPDLSRKGADRI